MTADPIVAFCRDVVRGGAVYSFTAEETFPVYPVDSGRARAVPFWSTSRRARAVRGSHEQYTRYAIARVAADEFLAWLVQLRDDGYRVGLNWSADGLTGPDVPAGELHFALERALRPPLPVPAGRRRPSAAKGKAARRAAGARRAHKRRGGRRA
jgi:hypothetical protein